MRKFKLFFYPIYLLAAVLVLYFGADILSNMDAYKEKAYNNFFQPNNENLWSLKNAPYYLVWTFIVLASLMLIELVVENFQIINLKRRARKAEEEVVKYKAMLYDRSQDATPPAVDEEEDDDEDNLPQD